MSKPAVHTPEPDSPEPDSFSSETEESEVYFHTPEAVASLNMCLADIGETPYSQVKGHGKTYSSQKITEAMKHTVISWETTDDGSEMIEQLKEKFQSSTQRSQQLQILTVLPKVGH